MQNKIWLLCGKKEEKEKRVEDKTAISFWFGEGERWGRCDPKTQRKREGGTVHSVLIPEECVLLGRRRSQPALLDNCLTSAAMEGCTVVSGCKEKPEFYFMIFIVSKYGYELKN